MDFLSVPLVSGGPFFFFGGVIESARTVFREKILVGSRNMDVACSKWLRHKKVPNS
jgi:hypothetical protein